MEDGNVKIHFVRSVDQLADIFTKALTEQSFNRILQFLGMIEVESVLKPPSVTTQNLCLVILAIQSNSVSDLFLLSFSIV